MGKNLFSLTGLLIALGLFVAVNAFAKVALRRSHIDLTERKLYSLSQGTRNILEKLEEPQDLRLYFTPEEAPDGSPIPAYAQRVRELLEEYTSAANGKLRLTVIDPKPFTEEEDQAAQAGLRGIPINEVGDKLYFGLVATNSVDTRETIPFFDPSREEALEYDITQIVYRLGNPDRPVVGVLSSIPLSGGAPDPRTGRQAQPWTVYQLLSQALEVRTVEPQSDRIDPEIDVLLLVHPKDLSDATLYAIDQFVMAGGHIMAFVDPYCFFDPNAQADPRTGMGGDHSSQLDRLLESYGVKLDSSKIAGDRIKAQQIDSPSGPIFCPVVLAMDSECLEPTDVAIRDLSNLNLLLAGSFEAIDGATTTMTPLVQTSEEGSGSLDAMQLQFGQPDFVRLTESFVPDKKRRAVAVRVSGAIKSAFPDGPPAKPEGAAQDESNPLPAHLAESKEPLQAVLVADADILADPLWTSDRGFFRQITAGNGSLAVNVLENLCGSSDLISLRSREGFQRPFTKKAELEQAAGERLKAKQKEIEAALRETEAKLAKLQGPQEAAGGALLSPEQEAELERANRTYLDQRRELREVRSQLNADIKSLGTRLKLFNTLAIPLLLLIVALLSAKNQVRSRRTQ